MRVATVRPVEGYFAPVQQHRVSVHKDPALPLVSESSHPPHRSQGRTEVLRRGRSFRSRCDRVDGDVEGRE